jgi:hypothetical protein
LDTLSLAAIVRHGASISAQLDRLIAEIVFALGR